MANLFERLAAVSRQTVERVHGKAIRIYPINSDDPNARAALSTTDLPYETSAAFFENTMMESEARSQPLAGGSRLNGRALQRTASIRLIEGKPLATNFYVERIEDGAFFTITSFDPDGLGQVLAVVAIAKSPLIL
jgi:hypothetical protein